MAFGAVYGPGPLMLQQALTISIGQDRRRVDTDDHLPLSGQSDLVPDIFIQHHCHRLNTHLMLWTQTVQRMRSRLTRQTQPGEATACAFVWSRACYLGAGGVLQCDCESAAAAALCQDVLTRPRLEKNPTVECGHKHVTYHRTLR